MKMNTRIVCIVYIVFLLILQVRLVWLGGEPLSLWGSVLLGVMAVPCLGGFCNAVGQCLSVRSVCRNGISANAVIQDFRIESYRLKTYYPIIRFRDTEGIIHTLPSSAGMSFVPRKCRKGRQVKIFYPADHPEAFVIVPAYYYQSLIGIVMFGSIGMPCAAAALLLAANVHA